MSTILSFSQHSSALYMLIYSCHPVAPIRGGCARSLTQSKRGCRGKRSSLRRRCGCRQCSVGGWGDEMRQHGEKRGCRGKRSFSSLRWRCGCRHAAWAAGATRCDGVERREAADRTDTHIIAQSSSASTTIVPRRFLLLVTCDAPLECARAQTLQQRNCDSSVRR
eukprot:SAG11_NODE_2396_length_3406_cov_2.071666_3_plen_165_part_00